MAFRLLVPRNLLEALIAQALAEQPLECCGLLAGVREEAKTGEKPGEAVGRVVRRYPLVNAAASPREFLSDSRTLFDAYKDMRLHGLDVLAVYHSHPASAPVPSRTDLERNGMGDAVVCLIVSLASTPPLVRGWWLGETDYWEAVWEMIDELA
jgi:[CysO sulfur-carrier protein]-S-L-cysteine hydrolase